VETINKIKITSSSFHAVLEVIVFKETDNIFVGYAPAIDVSSYGDSEQQALEAVKEAIDIYFDYTRKKGTLERDLLRMGWHKATVRSKHLVAPDMEDIKKDNPLLMNIMNSPGNFRRSTVSIPA